MSDCEKLGKASEECIKGKDAGKKDEQDKKDEEKKNKDKAKEEETKRKEKAE